MRRTGNTILCCLYMAACLVTVPTLLPAQGSIMHPESEQTGTDSSINRYLEQIATHEQEYGAMDPQLGEMLLGLGLQYQAEGEYGQAAQVLDRALHIKRTNEGIQNPTQVPILEALIKANTAAQQWQELDRNYHLLLWVHQRNLDSNNPDLLTVFNRIGNWKLTAYKLGLLKQNPERTIRDLAYMYESTIRMMEEVYGENDTRLVGPLNGRAMAGYQLAELEMNKSLNEFESPGSRTRLRLICRNVVTRMGIRRVCTPQVTPDTNYFINQQGEKSLSVSRELQEVGKALRRIVDIQAANTPVSGFDLAQSLAHLGDWYLLNGKRRAAHTAYQNAYEILASNEQGQTLIDEFFGKPQRIPLLAMYDTGDEASLADDMAYVTLEFKVTALGKAREIEVIGESDPENFVARKYARQHVRSSLFRPRLENGEAVETEKVVLQLTGEYLKRDSDEGISSYSDPQDSRYTSSRIRK